MKLSVIIVNYNVKYFLEQCLYSVQAAIGSLETQVLVFDNNSTDNSLEYLEPAFPWVTFIRSEQNNGFGKANNMALEKATGDYILLLNPDTIIPEDCFTKCIHFLESKPNAGALGIRMLDGSGVFLPESKRSLPDVLSSFYKLSGLSDAFPASPVFNKYALGHLKDSEDHEVDVLAGAFMFFTRKAIERTGGFDEAFFMYGEDIDLSYRLKLSGFQNWYFSGCSIIHFKGESAKKGSLNHTKMFYKAMTVFVNKHYRGKGATFFNLVLHSGILASGVLSWMSTSVNKVFEKKPSGSRGSSAIAIVGSEKEFNECLQILNHSLAGSPNKAAVNHIRVDHLDQLNKACKMQHVEQIIFTSGTITYKEIISTIQTEGPAFTYRFHASGSRSIIGSDSKNTTGDFIAID